MAIINSGSYPQDLRPGIKAWFGADYKDYDPKYDKIFEMRSSTRNYEEDALDSGLGLAVEKPEGSSITYDSGNQGITPRYRHITYGLGFVITQEMLEDGNIMGKAERYTKKLKYGCMRAKEVVAANVLNRAFNSSYTMTGGDAKELCATDHATRSGNQANELATAADLSEAALEQAVIDIRNMVDDRGLRIAVQPRKLVIPTGLEFDAHRILFSPLRVNSANNDLNALKSLSSIPEGILVNPYLTDTDAWFILTDAPEGLIYYNRKDLTVDSDNDHDTNNMRVKALFRCSFGWSDFRGIYGSPGA